TNALAQKLGVPVALISAAKGEGIEPVLEFLTGQFAVPAPVELPVLNDIPKCRQWATRIGNEASYRPPAPPIWTRRLDAVFLHPVAGPLVFLAVVVAVFQTIFTGAEPLMNAVERMVAASGDWVAATLPSSVIRDVLVEGVWGGVGSVLVFLPQILLLFLFIGVLEDSGYLA
ncbi:MAG: ferrous iron transporter B, partial [bacterium]|nr:ferrous iron transporter B [bacterium]